MKVRFAIAICCLLPAGYQVLCGGTGARWAAGASLAVVTFSVVAERWAVRHPRASVARILFRGSDLSLSDAAFSALIFLGLYLLVVTFAIRFNRLEDPVFLTVSFFAVLLGLMALVGTILLGIDRLRTRGRAS